MSNDLAQKLRNAAASYWRHKTDDGFGRIEVTIHLKGIVIEVTEEHSIDNYCTALACKADLPRDKARELASLLYAHLFPETDTVERLTRERDVAIRELGKWAGRAGDAEARLDDLKAALHRITHEATIRPPANAAQTVDDLAQIALKALEASNE